MMRYEGPRKGDPRTWPECERCGRSGVYVVLHARGALAPCGCPWSANYPIGDMRAGAVRS